MANDIPKNDKGEKVVNGAVNTDPQDVAPDAGGAGAPHLTANKELLNSPADRPADDATFVTRTIEAPAPEDVDPFDGQYDRNVDIPRDLEKVITADVADRPEHVILTRDNGKLTAPGTYRNVDNLDEIVAVEQGATLPEGMRLIADHYLVREPLRSQRLGRTLRNINDVVR